MKATSGTGAVATFSQSNEGQRGDQAFGNAIVLLALCIACLAYWSPAIIAAEEPPHARPTRSVHVAVTVQEAGGAAVPEFPVGVVSRAGFVVGPTDANGVFAGELSIPSDGDLPEIIIDAASLQPDAGFAPELCSRSRSVAERYLKEFVFPDDLMRVVDASETSVSINVVLQPSIPQVWLKMDADFDRDVGGGRGTVFVRGSLWVSSWVFGLGKLEVGGLRRGQSNDVFVETGSSRMLCVNIPASAGQAPLPSEAKPLVVNISTQEVSRDGGVRITIGQRAGLACEGALDCGSTVTVVRSDGSQVYRFYLMPDDDRVPCELEHGRFQQEQPFSLGLPAGAYFVCPGDLAGVLQMGMYDLLKAGNAAALDPHNVPRFVVTAGQTAVADIDAPAALAAVRAALGR